MNANDFVRELSASAPSVKDLCAIGLSVAEAEVFRAGYICMLRNDPLSLNGSNELLDLASHWDVGNVEIGMVRLSGAPSAYQDRGTLIGLVEADPLVITDADSELVVEEAGTAGHVLWRAARSPSQFLDALALAARFFSDRTTGAVDFDDLEASKATAIQCAAASGGDNYAEFYFMLLGAG